MVLAPFLILNKMAKKKTAPKKETAKKEAPKTAPKKVDLKDSNTLECIKDTNSMRKGKKYPNVGRPTAELLIKAGIAKAV